MKKKKKNVSTVAGEPHVEYGRKEMVFFKSFEEMNEHDNREHASLSYAERLERLNYLLKHFYKKELEENKTLGNKIYFD